MSKGKDDENHSIPVDILAAAIAKAIEAGKPSAELQTGMSRERVDRVMDKHTVPLRSRIIKGHNPDTGSTFDMVVLESRTHKSGRVVRLENYREPERAFVPMDQGGLMPDGMIVWLDPKNRPNGGLRYDTPRTMMNKEFKFWLATTFWHDDLRRIANGAPLRTIYCVEANAIESTPWGDGTLWSDDRAAE
jgi:hypothetical protein